MCNNKIYQVKIGKDIFMKKIWTFFNGFCMALADSVPGVSGGTVAFLMGFYDDFINSLNNLISGTKEQRKAAFFYLVNLGLGWVVSFILAVIVLANVFESHIYAVSSLFMGFILFAVPIVINEEKKCLAEKKSRAFFILIGIALVALITVLNSSGAEGGFNPENLSVFSYLYIFVAGAIAVCAMILPGISGSTLMLIMGIYLPLITGIKDLLHMDFHALPMIISFGLGIIAGVLSVIKLIKIVLEKHRAATVYLIIGLMLGSLYAIAMGPETLDIPQEHMTLSTFNVLFFIIGGAVIVGMQLAKRLTAKKEK